MNRSIFETLPDFDGRKEFINMVMDENGKDIEKAKKSAGDVTAELDSKKAELEKANSEIEELKKTISDLNASVGDVDSLKAQISEFQEKQAQMDAEKKKAVYEANMRARFDTVVGESKFVNDFTQDGAYKKFKKMIEDEANAGKSDKDVYSELIRDNDTWFAQKQSFVNMTGVQHIDTSLLDAEKFKQLSLIQQMAFANEHPAEYEQLSKMI